MYLFKDIKARVSDFLIKENSLYLIDETNRVFIFEGLNFFRGFKIKLPNNNPNEKSTKFSKNGKFLAITNNNNINILDLQSKKKIAEIKNDDVVLSVGFDEEERYLLIGDMKGIIKLYNIEASKTVFKVKYIESILDVDIDDEVIMGGCYNKSVIFIDRINGAKKERKMHIKKVKKVKTNYYCISSDESSRIVKWDKYKYDKKDSISFYKEFKDFIVNGNILIILTNKNIALYDLEKEAILNDNFIEIKEGDKLAFIDRYNN